MQAVGNPPPPSKSSRWSRITSLFSRASSNSTTSSKHSATSETSIPSTGPSSASGMMENPTFFGSNLDLRFSFLHSRASTDTLIYDLVSLADQGWKTKLAHSVLLDREDLKITGSAIKILRPRPCNSQQQTSPSSTSNQKRPSAEEDARIAKRRHRINSTKVLDACAFGDVDALKRLFEQNPDLHSTIVNLVDSEDGCTPVFIAAEGGHLECLRFLIDAGADVDKRNRKKATPLYIACVNGHHEIVRALLRARADVDTPSTDQEMLPLYAACLEGRDEVVNALLDEHDEHGVVQMINCAGVADGSTALMACCERGWIGIARLLIKRGADVNARAHNGATALFYAAHSGNIDVAQLLLQGGADVDAKRGEECTPLYQAIIGNHYAMVLFLLENRATCTQGAVALAHQLNRVAVLGLLERYLAIRQAEDRPAKDKEKEKEL